MLFPLTRAFRVLADRLVSSTLGQFAAASNNKAVPPSTRIGRKAVAAFFEPLEDRALMSTYYVSPSGSDSNRGTSVSAPWKSINKVNGTNFRAGDSVLFQGGQTFYGSLRFNGGDGGSATSAFTVGSYNGRATINSGNQNGAWVLNSTGIWFENLKFVGSRGDTQSQDGIRIEAMTGGKKNANIRVDNCDISGYAQSGICFGGDYNGAGFNGIRITNNNLYNNVMSGLQAWSVQPNMIEGAYIAYNQAHDNYGDGTSRCTGSGLMLQGLDNSIVEHNAAFHNGAVGGNGGVGIWTYDSNKVTIQYNSSYSNRTTRGEDGDGYDFDANTSNSVMQYNYSADNDGGGFDNDQWKNNSTQTGNVIRYNVSQNDGRLDNYGGIDLWGKVLNTQVYNNTVYISRANSGTPSAIRIHNSTVASLHPSNLYVANNIFVSADGTSVVNYTAQDAAGASNVKFDGNVYHSYGSSTAVIYAGRWYTSIASFRSGTGQETVNGHGVGAFVDPQLTAPGAAVSTSNTNALTSLSAYQLKTSSPVFSTGVNIGSLFGASALSTDYYGDRITAATASGADLSGVTTSISNFTTSTTSTTTTTTTGSSTSTNTSSTSTTVHSTVGSSMAGYDIGGPAVRGANSFSGRGGSSQTITAGGADVWGSSDSFRYVYKTLTGNGTIIAHLASLSAKDTSAKAGVMIRNSALDAKSANVSMLLFPNSQASLQTRSTEGGSTGQTSITGKYSWVKLVRSGNSFTGYVSTNGKTWVRTGTTTVSMGQTVAIGLAVTSHDKTKSATAKFDNFSVFAN